MMDECLHYMDTRGRRGVVELAGQCNVSIEQASMYRANKINKHVTFSNCPTNEETHKANVISPIVLTSNHTDTGNWWSASFT
jgi:hypothetical protein